MNIPLHSGTGGQSPSSFIEEWTAIQDRTQKEMHAVLMGHGGTERLLAYVSNMKGYPRVPCFSAAWISDPEERGDHAMCHCMHAVGVKLLDDVVDQDQDVANADLMLGHVLIHDVLARLPATPDVLRFAQEAWRPIWRHVVREPTTTLRDIDEWFIGAEVKAGRMMEFYGRLSARIGRHVLAPEDRIARAMNLVGRIYMVGDDIRDWRELGERRSNLFAMIENDLAARQRTFRRLSAMWDELSELLGTYPPALDFVPEIERIAGKWQKALHS